MPIWVLLLLWCEVWAGRGSIAELVAPPPRPARGPGLGPHPLLAGIFPRRPLSCPPFARPAKAGRQTCLGEGET